MIKKDNVSPKIYEVRPFSMAVENLNSLRDFFLSSMGPKGSYKILITSAGQIRLTSTSNRLTAFLSGDQVIDPCAEAIINLVKGHIAQNGDFGLTVGALTCDFVRIFKDFWCTKSIKIRLEKAAKIISSELDSSTIPVDISNLPQMISIIKTVLRSKPAIVSQKSSRKSKEEFLQKSSVKILEGFLESIPSESSSATFDLSLAVHVGNNPDVKLVDGYFYQLPEIAPELEWETRSLLFQNRKDGEQVNVIFLNINLKDDCPEFTEMQKGFEFQQRMEFKYMKSWISRLAKFCEESKVEVVLNQKVICIEAQEIFLKKGIAVFERMGTIGLKKVFKMSGAKQTLENMCQELDPKILIGKLEKPKISNSGKSIQFYRKGSECKTLLVNQWSEDMADENQLIYSRAIDVLYKLLIKPEVFPGGGCLEINLFKSLIEEQESNPCDQLLNFELAKSFARLALSINKNTDEFLQPHYETQSGHLWYLSDDSGPAISSETTVIENVRNNRDISHGTKSDKLLLDFAESKRNGIFAALETAETLASISKIIFTN